MGYISGVFLGFSLNKRFTFKEESQEQNVEIRKYFIVYAASLLIGLWLLWTLVYLGINTPLAYLLVMCLTTATNYLGSNYFVFNSAEYMKKVDFLIYKFRYLITYIIIGLGSIFLEVFLIELLKKNSSNIYPITVIGFVAGVIFSFILNAKLNFDVPKNQNLKMFNLFLSISIFAFLLNLGLIKIIFQGLGFGDYSTTRFMSAAVVFGISYSLHRRVTFKGVKKVGIAVYLSGKEDVAAIKNKVLHYPDFIHIDLVDSTFNPNAGRIDLSKGEEARKHWPRLKKMTHIMSKNPSAWIKKVAHFSDYIIVHSEIDENIKESLNEIKGLGKKRGLSILYSTPLESIRGYMKNIDLLQILSVPKPGGSEQHMEKIAIDKLDKLNKIKKSCNFELCFDGGIKLTNIHKINADYIVSASAVLKAKNVVNAIYAIKTNGRYYYSKDKDLKVFIKNEILGILGRVDYIVSGTIVGSFAEKESTEGIGDIDIVVIIDKLTKERFEGLLREFQKLKRVIEVDFDMRVVINPTLGPLKFNKQGNVVLHLMVYDVKGHVLHCKKSPFTCLDWQKSKIYVKKHMADIYKVHLLKPRDFFDSRRGITDYMKDVESGQLSYREYEFQDDEVIERVKSKKMDSKDMFEFAYHIMRFVMSNFLKLYYQDNDSRKLKEIVEMYFSLLKNRRDAHINFFAKIKKYKDSNKFPEWDSSAEERLQSFLKDFEDEFRDLFFNTSKMLYFIRHQKTQSNKGKENIFLGQKSNLSILPIKNDVIKNLFFGIQIDKIFSSPLIRCIQTANKIKDARGLRELIIEDDLKEINYGLLDGKDAVFMEKEFPDLIQDWREGKDPRFPDGENTKDVSNRVLQGVQRILNDYSFRSGLVCTHNVVMRCIIGSTYRVPLDKWHLLRINHLDPYEFIGVGDKIYSNITREQEGYIFGDLFGGGHD